MKDLIKETFKVTYVKEGMNQTKNLIKREIKVLKGKLKPLGEWFTSGSPLGKALRNGGLLILPSQQGGTHKVEFTKEEIV